MASDPAVKTGFWTNYEPDGKYSESYLWTVSEIWGTIFKVLLGVAFGIAWPWAKVILQRTWLWFTLSWPWLKRKWKDLWYGSGSHDEEEPLLERPPEQQDQSPKRRGLMRWIPVEKADLVLAVITALVAFLYAVAGGAVGEIPADTLGRTYTPKSACGPWDLKRDVDRRVKDFDKLVLAQKEARAAAYGRDCYGSHSVYTPGRCDFFESPQIEYTVEKVDCPFKCLEDRCICATGSYETALRLSTGSFSADKLGLNGRDLPFIRRTSTFVPLDINNGFVVETGKLEYRYDLGPVYTSEGYRNYTFDTWGIPFNWDIAAYSVSVYESTPFPEYDAWQPIKELARPENTYMTAIFISPCRIAYNGRCEDPIFLATDDLGDIGLPNKFYREDTRARVLIAIDEMEVCRQKDTDCYPPSESNPEFGIEYEFVRTALRRSSTFQSIENRLGEALVASESISDFESPQLDKEQWIIESQALFNTSLARLQFNMLDMATGNHPTGAAAGGFESAYENSTPAWAKRQMGRMCDNYKFHMSGPYTNISIPYAVALLLVPIVLFVLSRNTKAPLDDNDPPRIYGNYMVFDRIIWWICRGAKWARSIFSKGPSESQESRSQESQSQEAEPHDQSSSQA
ncbi:hypothetical protein PFICI_14702 [Pestalotiopsis fici W106-1]|uniref:Uncharacterized protein n=1 Tax=Pestalotiopsis fici (strain W106-1 / CGMCC3.15140) TaxID=1229662 RepID=W3WLT5_PESFW|nr:uncharacterized protein PFICI_14702 [Pestalotiopsis fici W106-1]ETS73756.1 hypothetical protein PFICI_14702 [Pestalotiopsis fici W106-1]